MGKDAAYETFDSGNSKTIPDKENYDHKDDGKGSIDVTQGAIPTVPQSK